MPTTIATALHEKPLLDHIIKKTGWSDTIFNMVNWDLHEHAFKHMSRNKQVTMAKLFMVLSIPIDATN
jgi:hypothetical protein